MIFKLINNYYLNYQLVAQSQQNLFCFQNFSSFRYLLFFRSKTIIFAFLNDSFIVKPLFLILTFSNNILAVLYIIVIKNTIFNYYNSFQHMNFNPIKRMFKSALNSDPFQQIFWNNPTAETYHQAILQYNRMDVQQRCSIVKRCLNKLAKPKQIEQTLADLILLHKIMRIDWINIGKRQINLGQQKTKDKIAETNLVKFYYKFIIDSQDNILNNKKSLQNQIEFAKNYMQKCIDIIKMGFAIDYCILHSLNQVIVRIALKDIFQDIREGLQFTNNFIRNNAKLIYSQNDNNAFLINQVYEDLIFINKNIHKITVLIKKSQLQINLPIYQLDKQLNLRIQRQMMARKQQKMVFKTQKQIGKVSKIGLTQKNIGKPQMNDFENCQSMNQIYLDEDDILIQHDLLLE